MESKTNGIGSLKQSSTETHEAAYSYGKLSAVYTTKQISGDKFSLMIVADVKVLVLYMSVIKSIMQLPNLHLYAMP